jgi:predicted HAD superfamily hydrolase
MTNSHMLIYSFDVFDTVLVRDWAKPTDLFWELGNILNHEKLISISNDEWMELRIKAEKNARSLSSTGEITLNEIYRSLKTIFSWTDEEFEIAMQKEIYLESICLHPVPEICSKIKALHLEQARIVYISDMYLPKKYITDLLMKNQIWSDTDKLYLSSEFGSTKAGGNLYSQVFLNESASASQLHHTGDNLNSDFKVPIALGAKAQYLTKTHLNRYEDKISETPELPLKFRSLLAGASRLTRLMYPENGTQKEVIWETAASVIAPVLFGYVYWCLEEALERGIRRLYFVSRDGQILLRIAKVICINWNYDIDCRYLYGSRQAWHSSAIQSVGKEELDWIFDPTEFLSVESVCERVNISPNQIKDILTAKGYPESQWNSNLSANQCSFLKELFQESEITNLIISTAKEYREKTIGYFKQNNLDENIKFGIVDIGWNGRLQRSLGKILNDAEIYPKSGTCGFYFSLANRRKAFPEDKLFAYFSDVDIPRERDFLSGYRALYEIFVAADHGGTVKFEYLNGSYAPILRSKENKKAIDWGILAQQNAIVEFSEKFTASYNNSSKKCKPSWFISASEILLRLFLLSPSIKEAEVYGSFEIFEDQTENICYILAPKYGFYDYIKFMFFGLNVHHNVWLPGSIARSNSLIRFLYMHQPRITYVKKYIKRILKTSRHLTGVIKVFKI